MRIFFLTVQLLVATTFVGQAWADGVDSSGGGGVLSRLLVFSQQVLIDQLGQLPADGLFAKNPGLKSRFMTIRPRLEDDLRSIHFIEVSASQEIKDPHMGYKTWIRILSGPTLQIQFNPDPDYYQKIVQSLSVTSWDRTISTVPQLNDVLGFLLHEMGHHYGLGEEDAWRLAFELAAALNKIENLEAPTKYCHYHFWDRRDGTETWKKQEDFVLDGALAEKLITLDLLPGAWDKKERKDPPQAAGHVSLSHDVRGKRGSILKLTIVPRYGEDTNLILDARSELDYDRIFVNPRMVGLVMWCRKTPTPGVKYSRDAN